VALVACLTATDGSAVPTQQHNNSTSIYIVKWRLILGLRPSGRSTTVCNLDVEVGKAVPL